MKQHFTIRGVAIEPNVPKICVPLMPRDLSGLDQALDGLNPTNYDIVEWRADAMAASAVTDYRLGLTRLRQRLGESVPILFTLRTRAQGGAFLGSAKEYAAAVGHIAALDAADMVDIELSAGEDIIRAVTDTTISNRSRIIVSHHNFEKTYPTEDIVKIYEHMFNLGADIAKIALMAQNFEDCLTAVQSAAAVRRRYPEHAIIMTSMGRYGLMSRIMAQEFGSAITFGASMPGGPSAPGQISLRDTRLILDIIKKYTEF